MLIIPEEKILEFKNFLARHEFFFIAGHKEPDGDCVYSCLAMANILDKLNLPYQLLNSGPFKRTEIKDKADLFSSQPVFLPESKRKKTGLIILDCSETQRLGEIAENLRGLDTYIIDHHLTANVTTDCIIDSTSPAAACLVQQIHEKIAGPLSKESAEYLFFAIATDTGYFRFLSEKSSEVFKQSARLIEAGANPGIIYDKITGGKPFSTRKLIGLLLLRAERYCGNKLVITYETAEDSKKFAQEGRDSDALYSLFLAADGIEAVVFFRQENEHTCTAGFRSKKDIDVSKIAAKFGGGGHKNASGASIEGKLEAVIQKVIEEFSKIL